MYLKAGTQYNSALSEHTSLALHKCTVNKISVTNEKQCYFSIIHILLVFIFIFSFFIKILVKTIIFLRI